MKRALVLMGHPGHGGIMRSLAALGAGAPRHGWQMRFVFPHRDEQIAANGLAGNCRYVPEVHRWRRARGRLALPRVLWQLSRAIRRDGACLLYSATLSTLPYALLAARLCRIDEVAHVYSTYDSPASYRKHWLARARHAVVPSRDSLARVTAAIGSFAGRAAVVYNGVDIARIRAAATRAPGEGVPRLNGGPVVGMVANLDRRKNPMALVEAVARIVPEVPSLRVVLVGVFPEIAYRDAVLGRARALGIEANVVALGYQPNPFPLVAGCDVVALPTLRDPFPIALLEAMALGKPIVATAVGGIPEMLVDGESGFVVPAGDIDALATRLLTLLRDPERRVAMGEAARRRLETAFSLEGFVRGMCAVFDTATRAG
jgi:glycosyltransferase involved in cell wall biosynthesis